MTLFGIWNREQAAADWTCEAHGSAQLLQGKGFHFAALGRVDNRRDLASQLPGALSPDADDCTCLLAAYRHWGEEAPSHLHGDWAFAAWHPADRRLFLARDRHGVTGLYYYADPQVFAFASSLQQLLALKRVSIHMDELYLAQVMVSWPAYHGERTAYTPIRRLPPAHWLAVTPDHLVSRRYWRLEDTPEFYLPRREDYAEAFREVFDTAVRDRLRGARRVGSMLSGGLDSGAVTATAAAMLQQDGRRLPAFSSVPMADTSAYVGQRFGNEYPFAVATARHAGNVDLHTVDAAALSPVSGIRRYLDALNEPSHAACNAFWMLALRDLASAQGCDVLLGGQAGNAGVSWTGHELSQPLSFQLRQLGIRKWVKERLKQYLPATMLASWHRYRAKQGHWYRSSAIHPQFAERMRLFEQYLSDQIERCPASPREQRLRILKPGRSLIGALHAALSEYSGVRVLDPTGDARVLSFTLSVPDHVFIDPETGLDRWLIREAMKGRLPDEVRLNRRRGRQAADLVPRLRATAWEVEQALDECARGPAAEYVDVPYMRETWHYIQTHDTPDAFRKAVTILTRGIMAGLWVNRFYGECRHTER